jgi:hypothetical protein
MEPGSCGASGEGVVMALVVLTGDTGALLTAGALGGNAALSTPATQAPA